MTVIKTPVEIPVFRLSRKVYNPYNNVRRAGTPTVWGIPISLIKSAICLFSVVLAVLVGSITPWLSQNFDSVLGYLGLY